MEHTKGFINIQNINDNKCFKWWLVRYLHPADNNPVRIRKIDEDLARKIDLKDIKFPVKIRNIHKTEKKKNCIGIILLDYKSEKR